MATINLNPSQRKSYDLDELLRSDVSSTDISSTDNVSATDSRSKYQNEWKRNHKDTIRIDVPKGYKDLLKAEATKRGMSLTKLIVNAVVEYVKNHPI